MKIVVGTRGSKLALNKPAAASTIPSKFSSFIFFILVSIFPLIGTIFKSGLSLSNWYFLLLLPVPILAPLGKSSIELYSSF